MAQFLSDQETKIQGVINGAPQGDNLLDPRDLYGRVRVAYFSYEIPASSGPGSTDNIMLTRIPNNGRILNGKLFVTALGTSCTGSIGYAGATTRYLSGADLSAAATVAFADTVAFKEGDEMTADTDLLLTFAGAAPAASGTILGYVFWVLD